MSQQDEWDDNTQHIVTSRLIRDREYRFLTLVEAEVLRALCSTLIDDDRADVIQYVLCHIDQTLDQSIGESERKVGIPKAQTLIREGLRRIQAATLAKHRLSYMGLDPIKQRQELEKLSENKAEPALKWAGFPQKELFMKLLTYTIEAYYSHPTPWSEIGYGGPAYPRGYIRTQLGQLDPWEAQPGK